MGRLQEIEKRLRELAMEIRAENSDLDKIEKEMNALKEERNNIEINVEKRAQLLLGLQSDPKVEVIAKKENESEERKTMQNKENVLKSTEYRSAFFKNLVGKELSVEERAAFTHTTTNSGALVPTQTLNEIWDLVSKKHAIMDDVKKYMTGTILEVVAHKAIVAGAAKTVAEGIANDDEKNTFAKVTLAGKDFSKHVEISYAMANMSIEALEQYLVQEIAENIGEALADDTIAQIKADVAVENKINTAKVKELAYKDLTGAFAVLKNVSDRVVYVSNETFYNYIVSMTDTNGRPIFQPNLQDDAQGVLLGAKVKIEESVAVNEIMIGDPQKVVCNVVQDLLIEQDRNIKNHTKVYSGYMRAESKLVADKAFTILTVKQA